MEINKRSYKPVYSKAMGMWVISSYSDVIKVLKNPDLFEVVSSYELILAKLNISSETLKVMDEIVPVKTSRISTSDLDSHNRLRSPINHFFTPKNIKNFEPVIEKIVLRKIKELSKFKTIDLVANYSRYISLESILTFLGIPSEDFTHVYKLHREISKLFLIPLSNEEQIQAAQSFRDLKIYIMKLINEKRKNLKDDLISFLSKGADKNELSITIEEIIQILCDIISAGFDTTFMAMNWTFYSLLSEPNQWDFLTSSNDDTTVKNCVAETLRLNMAQMGLTRIVKKSVNFGEIELPRGALLYVMHTYANRDPLVFSKPDLLNKDRADLNKQLTFGAGAHYCLGAQLAKTEIEISLRCLKDHFPLMKVAPGNDSVEVKINPLMKTVQKLIVTLNADRF